MPFRTKNGTHYHMTEGCCNAFIQCDTKGLEPCSICCGGGKGTTGGSGLAGGAPGAGSPVGPTAESMEAADRWRRGATDALFGGGIDSDSIKHRGKGMTYDEWKAQQQAEAELDRKMAEASSPDYDFDEMDDDAFPFGDGGKYSLYGSSDHFPADGNFDAFYQTEASDALAEAGLHGMRDGMGAPTDMTTDVMAKTLTDAHSEGLSYDEWDAETRAVAQRAGVPDAAQSLGLSGETHVFVTSSISTRNPNNPNDHFGEWLYDVRDIQVVAKDGTDLTPTIHVVRNLESSMRRASERFDKECLEEARMGAQRPRRERREAEVNRARQEAKERYEREVSAPWQAGYDAWRAEHDEQAKDMERAMRRDRPEWRHQYIPGDVEERMRRQYVRSNPKPPQWSYALPEYQEATERGIAEADRQLQAEGYDMEAATRRLAQEIREKRDPEGRNGVSAAMRRNYDDAMRRLGQYPGATDIALSDLPLSWGNTMGMPVRLPKEWKNRAS